MDSYAINQYVKDTKCKQITTQKVAESYKGQL